METADVVVIGAGANGTSTAFHLAKAGVKRVVVVERQYLGSGATGKSGALVRMHYTNEPEVRLAFESLKYFQHWKDMVGGDCCFQPLGLLVFPPPEYPAHLEANLSMMRRVGVNTRTISPQDAQELDPSLWTGDVTRVAYEPESGYADPNATIYSLARASADLGVTFQFETEVTGVLISGDRVKGVETTKGTILAPVVVIIAGVWANQLFAPLHIDLGLVARPGRVSVFRWPMERSSKHMTYMDKIHRIGHVPLMAIVRLWEQRVWSLNQVIPTTTVKRCRRTISMLAASNSPGVSPSCARVLCEATGGVCSWIALIRVQ